MSEIELVINITKHEWEYLNKLVKNGDQLGHYERLLVNGTPLPKGHGRLIDESQIPGDNEWDFSDRLMSTPTIVKAEEKTDASSN